MITRTVYYGPLSHYIVEKIENLSNKAYEEVGKLCKVVVERPTARYSVNENGTRGYRVGLASGNSGWYGGCRSLDLERKTV